MRLTRMARMMEEGGSEQEGLRVKYNGTYGCMCHNEAF